MICRSKSVDIVIDLETTGVTPGCNILSIGACSFDEQYKFYVAIDPTTGKDFGLSDSPSTMDWWNKQPVSTRMEAFGGLIPLVTALGDFADWIRDIERRGNTVYIWGNGAAFDQPILEAGYRAVGMKKPWGYMNDRCYRTLKNLPWARDVKAGEFEGVEHHSFHDARHEARHALKIIRAINLKVEGAAGPQKKAEYDCREEVGKYDNREDYD